MALAFTGMTPTKQLRVHRDAALVPEMRPQEYAELLADIRQRGIVVPLDVHGNTVLDGRHRLKIARELGLPTVPVHQVDLKDDSETVWLLKAAVLRRHLSDDQRAMMAAMYAARHPQKRGPKPPSIFPGPRRSGNPGAPATTRAPAQEEAAKGMNVAPKRTRNAAAVLGAAPELADQVHCGKLKLAQAVRQVKHQQAHVAAAQLPKPDGVFDVIVIDPPWRYDRQPADVGLRGEVDYATMTLDQLKAERLPAADNCVLWLWTTNSFMREAYDLLDAWGFTAKTILTWDKVNLGLGDWLRNVTEHCILAVRGRPVVTLSNQTTLIREARREHSRKPETFYALVNQLCPGRKYEHFSRTPRAGYVGYGIEAGRFPVEDVG